MLDPKLIDKALQLNKQISSLKIEESEVRGKIRTALNQTWVNNFEADKFCEVITEDRATVDFTVKGEITEEEFKSLGPYNKGLFEKIKEVNILNPEEMIKEITNAGLDPWDFVELKAKKSFMFNKTENALIIEKIVPREDILSNLVKVYRILDISAKNFIKWFLKVNVEAKLKLTRKDKGVEIIEQLL